MAQSMLYQSTIRSEAAPVAVTTVICLSSFEGSTNSHAIEDQPEVCSLSGGMMLVALNPYPLRYERHSRFPASNTRISSAFLAVSLLANERRYGLTLFRLSDDDGSLGAGFTPVSWLSSLNNGNMFRPPT